MRAEFSLMPAVANSAKTARRATRPPHYDGNWPRWTAVSQEFAIFTRKNYTPVHFLPRPPTSGGAIAEADLKSAGDAEEMRPPAT